MLIRDSPDTFRFGDFELDVGAYELRRNGRPVRIERQPMDLLLLLVERRSQLVLRSEIVDRLWGKDVFVDVETGVHSAIRKVRQALRDSPDAPKFVETVSGKGYRFIATVEVPGAPRAAPGQAKAQPAAAATASDAAFTGPPLVAASALSVGGAPKIAMATGLTRPVDDSDAIASAAAGAVAIEVELPAAPRAAFPVRRGLAFGLVALALLVGILVWARTSRDAAHRASPLTLAVLPFTNLSGDPAREYLTEGLAEETTTSLGQIDPEQMAVVARSTMRYKGTTKSAAEIGRELAADYLVESSLRIEDNRLRVTSTLVRVRDQHMTCTFGVATSRISARRRPTAVRSSTTREPPSSTQTTRWPGQRSQWCSRAVSSTATRPPPRCSPELATQRRGQSGRVPPRPRRSSLSRT